MRRFDLSRAEQETRLPEGARLAVLEPDEHPAARRLLAEQIGRASCRERV